MLAIDILSASENYARDCELDYTNDSPKYVTKEFQIKSFVLAQWYKTKHAG